MFKDFCGLGGLGFRVGNSDRQTGDRMKILERMQMEVVWMALEPKPKTHITLVTLNPNLTTLILELEQSGRDSFRFPDAPKCAFVLLACPSLRSLPI